MLQNIKLINLPDFYPIHFYREDSSAIPLFREEDPIYQPITVLSMHPSVQRSSSSDSSGVPSSL
jgi:hypothetical protein